MANERGSWAHASVGLIWGARLVRFGQEELILENDRFKRSAATEADARDATAVAVAQSACAAYGNEPSALIEVLHDVQSRHGDIPEVALKTIADALNLSRAEVYGVKSYYHDFQLPRDGRRIVQICLGEACRSRGAGALFDAVQARLEAGGVAVAAPVYCLGNCALSPSVMVDGVLHGRVDSAADLMLLAEGVEP